MKLQHLSELPRFMASIGFPPEEPHIHSSDFDILTSSPLEYMLIRRYGLTQPLRWSKALSHGSWLHCFLDHDPFDPALSPKENVDLAYQQASAALRSRLDELRAVGKELGIISDSLLNILDRESHAFAQAHTWYSAFDSIPVPSSSGTALTLRRYLNQPHMQIIGSEVPLSVPHPSGRELRGTFDKLLLNTSTNKLWILDLKSTDDAPTTRLSLCPAEFQTQHYLHLLECVLDPDNHTSPSLDALRSRITDMGHTLSDLSIGGMMHVAFQKPTIKFGQNDRNSTIKERTITRGPNKGEVRRERKYFGEPVFENYLARCTEWLTGTGDYANLATERATEPPVNFSFSHYPSTLDTYNRELYNARLDRLVWAACCEPSPRFFHSSTSSLKQWGTLSKYAMFAILNPSDWPSYIAHEHFVRHFREEDFIS